MKYLELPEIIDFNNLLGNLITPDGSRLQSRIEVFTCKAAGNDKKLLKQLETKFTPTPVISTSADSSSETEIESIESNTILKQSNQIIDQHSGINLKTFYFLISTMNNIFPDYDFSDVPTNVFSRNLSLSSLINHVNTSIFNTGVNRNTTNFSEFSSKMWDCIDEAVGGLTDCSIYSYDPEPFELEDPFKERGTIWSLNVFFYNKKLKRVLVLHIRQVNDFSSSYEDFTGNRSGAITPISSTS